MAAATLSYAGLHRGGVVDVEFSELGAKGAFHSEAFAYPQGAFNVFCPRPSGVALSERPEAPQVIAAKALGRAAEVRMRSWRNSAASIAV
jgi:hypothetical protein